MFLEISQNSQENTRVRVSFFNKVAGLSLGNITDITLSFQDHIPTFWKKTRNKLSTIISIQKYEGLKEKEMLINSFLYFSTIYCSLFNISVHRIKWRKWNTVKSRNSALGLYYDKGLFWGAYTRWGLYSGGVIHGRKIALRLKVRVFS